jgi:hypothetical protein
VAEITQIGHSGHVHICCPNGQEANNSAGAHRILSKGARGYAKPLVSASGGQDPRAGASKVASRGRNYSNWLFWPYMFKRLIIRQVPIESFRRVPEGMLNHWYWRAESNIKVLRALY